MQKYNKFIVGLGGAGAQFLVLTQGCTDPRVHGAVALVTALGVFITPNKQ